MFEVASIDWGQRSIRGTFGIFSGEELACSNESDRSKKEGAHDRQVLCGVKERKEGLEVKRDWWGATTQNAVPYMRNQTRHESDIYTRPCSRENRQATVLLIVCHLIREGNFSGEDPFPASIILAIPTVSILRTILPQRFN